MANLTFQIQFPSPAPPALMSRVLNFAEDLDRQAQREQIGSVDDIDHYGAGTFLLRTSAVRHLNRSSTLISKLLVRHMLVDEAVVSRVAA
jgi:hypothetical protein